MHLFAHYFDTVRHDFAFSWAWYNWISNITAGIIATVCVSLVWPLIRHRIEYWFDKRIAGHLHNHNSKLYKHIDDHMKELHKKIEEKN